MLYQTTFDFLTLLQQNNNREWFAANKKEYETAKENVLSLGYMLIDQLKSFDDNLGYLEPRKALYRIARDTRFSHNKDPYKPNFGMAFAPDGKKGGVLSGYYIHIEPHQSAIGCGVYMPEAIVLRTLRNAIEDDWDIFEKIVTAPDFITAFGGLNRESAPLKRAPKGFDPNSPAISYLQMKNYYVMVHLTDKEMLSKELPQIAGHYFKLMKPLHDFLNQAIAEI